MRITRRCESIVQCGGLIVGLMFFTKLYCPAGIVRLQPADTSNIVLENGIVRFEFDAQHGGLSAMMDLGTGVNHLQQAKEGWSLWSLVFAHGLQQRTLSNTDVSCTSSGVEKLADGSRRLTFKWDDLEWVLERMDSINTYFVKRDVILNGLSVRVTVDLPANSGIASWRIWVDNDSDMWGLWEVDFPRIDGFLASGEYDIAKPARPGLLLKACKEEVSGMYRGNDIPMQFLCAMKDSSAVYMAAHDRQAWTKIFALEPGGKFLIKTYAENMGVHGSDYNAPYPAMLGIYRGSWMEGCKLYRKFAVTTPWLLGGRLSQNNSVPDEVKDIGLWLRVDTFTMPKGKDWKDSPLLAAHIEAQKYFDVPIGVHWYTWHATAWDNGYPHFLPARPGIKEQARYLTSRGMAIMPHINGRLADSFNDDFEEYLPYTTKDQAGEPYFEYINKRKGRMTVMCPYTEFWQNKIAELVGDIKEELGVTAIYLDQIAASPPKLCFDESHGHPLGGGHWWVDGYNKMLQKVQKVALEKGGNMIVTSETNAEHYISGIDAFLQLPNDGRGIPMLEAVYSGYTLYFGTSSDFSQTTDRGWIMHQGRSFLWGCQNGWTDFEILKPEFAKRAAFLKQVGRYRLVAKKFLTFGELVGTIAHPETVTEPWVAWLNKSTATLPIIQGALWKAEDGSLGIILVNYMEEEKAIDLDIDPSRYGLNSASGRYAIKRLSPDGSQKVSVISAGAINRTETLGPWEIRVIEISARR